MEDGGSVEEREVGSPCPRCGAAVSEGTCPNCGWPAEPTEPAPPAPRRRRKPVVAAVVAGLVVAGLTGVVVTLGGDGDHGILPRPGAAYGMTATDPAATFRIVLVVFEGKADTIDFIQLQCAPKGELSLAGGNVAEDVRVEESRFAFRSDLLELEGRFVDHTRAQGTLRRLDADLGQCGVPEAAPWAAACDGRASPRAGGGSTIVSEGGCPPVKGAR
jgi:hypothetical protein